MIKYSFESTGRRPAVTGRVIDVGGANSYANGSLDAIVDVRQPQASARYTFIGDMCDPCIWENMLIHIQEHGKWDYAICTHTLEDLSNPIFVCQMMEFIAHKGVIIIPSKHRELARFSGPFRGFMHHRWVFDIVDEKLTAFPKSAYLEDPKFDQVHMVLPEKEELIVEWEGSIGLVDIMGNVLKANGSDKEAREAFDLLLR